MNEVDRQGDSATKITLVVNADDLGLTSGVNDGVFAAHRDGIVTSASLMVRHSAAEEAVARAKKHPRLGIGLHLDLGEWSCRNGEWYELYRVVDRNDATAIEQEVARQIERFMQLVGRNPTHLDSHQHVHREEPLRSIVISRGAELNIPVRHFAPAISYCGGFYGQYGNGQPWPEAIQVDGLLQTLATLQPGVTELACHPGWDDGLETMYNRERRIEVATLCDLRVKDYINDRAILLATFTVPIA